MPRIRLIKAANTLNVATFTIVSFLIEEGYEVENKPTEKLSEEQYNLVQVEFSGSADLKIVSKAATPVSPNAILPPRPSQTDSKPKNRSVTINSLEGLRGLRVMGKVLGSSTRHEKKESRSSTGANPIINSKKGEGELVYLGIVHKEIYEKGFGFVRKVKETVDSWFHVKWVNGENPAVGDYVVFSQRKSTKHPGKMEASWVQKFSNYSTSIEELQSWYDLTHGLRVQNEIRERMSPAEKEKAFVSELAYIKKEPSERTRLLLSRLEENFSLQTEQTEFKQRLIKRADEWASQQVDNSGLIFWWWMSGLGEITMPIPAIKKIFLNAKKSFQQDILVHLGQDGYLPLIEIIYAEDRAEGLLSLRSNSLEEHFIQLVESFLKAHLSIAEEADLFFKGIWNQLDINYVVSNYQELNSARLLSILTRRVTEPASRIEFLLPLINKYLNQHDLGEEDVAKAIKNVLNIAQSIVSKQTIEAVTSAVKLRTSGRLRRQIWGKEELPKAIKKVKSISKVKNEFWSNGSPIGEEPVGIIDVDSIVHDLKKDRGSTSRSNPNPSLRELIVSSSPGLSENEIIQLTSYLKLFKEHNCSEHWEVNEIISAEKIWGSFEEIRSLNNHGYRRSVKGILPKYFAIVCEVLEVGGDGGAKLLNATKY
jgi:cold shock CspA family protein